MSKEPPQRLSRMQGEQDRLLDELSLLSKQLQRTTLRAQALQQDLQYYIREHYLATEAPTLDQEPPSPSPDSRNMLAPAEQPSRKEETPAAGEKVSSAASTTTTIDPNTSQRPVERLEVLSPSTDPYAPPAPASGAHSASRSPNATTHAPPPTSPRPAQQGKMLERVIATLGTTITLLGVVFFLVQGTERGWLTPWGHGLLVATLSTLLLAAGTKLVKHRAPNPLTWDGSSSHNLGGLGLLATAYAALYADIIAAYSYYHWLSMSTSFLLATLLSLASIVHALSLNSTAFALLAVGASTFMACILTFSVDMAPYMLLLGICTVSLLFHFRTSNTRLMLLRTVPLALTLFFGYGSEYEETYPFVLLSLLLITHGTVYWFDHQKRATRASYVMMFLSGVLTISWLGDSVDYRFWGVGVLALALLVAAAFLRRGLSATSRGLLYMEGIYGVLTLINLLWGAQELYEGISYTMIALGMLYVAQRYPLRLTFWPSLALSLFIWVKYAFLSLEYVWAKPVEMMTRFQGSYWWNGETVPWTVVLLWGLNLVMLWFVYQACKSYFSQWETRFSQFSYSPMALATMFVVFLSLFSWQAFLVSVAFLFSYSPLSYTIAQMLSTLSYVAVSVFLWARQERYPRPWRSVALLLLFTSLSKLFFFDLVALDGLVRVLAFILTGVALLVLNSFGWLRESSSEESSEQQVEASLAPVSSTNDSTI